MAGMSTKRSVRVGDLLLREVADLLVRKVKDPRVKGATLTGVDVSNDLKHARIYFSLIGDEEAVREAHAGLESAKGFIKREVARRMALRYTPEIVFKHDGSLGEGARMEKVLRRIRAEETPEGNE